MVRRKQSGFELIAMAPWPIGFVLGIIGYVAVRYGIAWYFSSAGSPTLAAFGEVSKGPAFVMIAWILLGMCWAAAFFSFIARRQRSRLLEAQTSFDSLRAMNWKQFEMLVGEAFRRQGYRVEETGLGGADGGIDLRMSKNGMVTLVQCKQWRSQRVDVKVVREMYGLLTHHGADTVKIVAIGDFTPDAQRFAQGKPIELIHGEVLLALIRSVQNASAISIDQPTRPNLAAATTPDCPTCGASMVRRTNRSSHETFWGCPKYPNCRGTRPI